MMKNILTYFLFALVLFSCGGSEKQLNEFKLDGVWVPADANRWFKSSIPASPPFRNLPLILRSGIGNVSQQTFSINGDTLKARLLQAEQYPCENGKQVFWTAYILNKVSPDSLELFNCKNNETLRFVNLLHRRDTSIRLLECGFNSRGCMGNCPYFLFHLRRDSLFFRGESMNCRTGVGSLSASVSVSLLEELEKITQCVDWEYADTANAQYITDGWSYTFWVKTNKGEFDFSSQFEPKDPALAKLMYDLLLLSAAEPMKETPHFHNFPYSPPVPMPLPRKQD